MEQDESKISIIETGCGTGRISRKLLLNGDFTVSLLDISREALDIARKVIESSVDSDNFFSEII